MADTRPNILFIMSDDHASHAMSCYGSRINATPNLDRIAQEGMLFNHCFCTNSICSPSRATILTGTYNHVNRVTTLATPLDSRQLTFPQLLQRNGYQTAMIGKWHLGHGGANDPTGFDYWNVLPGQGAYHDPVMIDMGERKNYEGYTTDIITDLSLEWMRNRDPEKPFLLMCHHKAPHRPWDPDEKHADMYADEEIPEPDNLFDDYSNRAAAAKNAEMRVSRDLNARDLKNEPVPEGLSEEEETSWKYQKYIKDYLRCVASIDDNVGRLLDYLEEEDIAEETIVVYTSDQGFFLGDHGWYDKRFMYEESLRMPFIIRYPAGIEPGVVTDEMILNVDFAPTFLDYAEVDIPIPWQGSSFRPILEGVVPEDWQISMYYRYWMHGAHHNVAAHYGLRTHRYKLIYYYGDPLDNPGTRGEATPPEWELFDLHEDPREMNNVYHHPDYALIVTQLKQELSRQQARVRDVPYQERQD